VSSRGEDNGTHSHPSTCRSPEHSAGNACNCVAAGGYKQFVVEG